MYNEFKEAPVEAPRTTELPDKMSDLLELALGDLERIEKTPGYRVDMNQWVTEAGDKCFVCLAGSVLATRFGLRNVHAVCDFPSEAVMFKMKALNWLRLGDARQAAIDLGIPYSPVLRQLCRYVTPYDLNRDKFFDEQRGFVADLRAAGY